MYKHSVFLLLSVLLIAFTWKLFSCQYKRSVDIFTGSFNTKIQQPVLTLSTCFASYSRKATCTTETCSTSQHRARGGCMVGFGFVGGGFFGCVLSCICSSVALLRLAWDFFKQLKSVLHKVTFPIPGSRNKQHVNIYSD